MSIFLAIPNDPIEKLFLKQCSIFITCGSKNPHQIHRLVLIKGNLKTLYQWKHHNNMRNSMHTPPLFSFSFFSFPIISTRRIICNMTLLVVQINRKIPLVFFFFTCFEVRSHTFIAYREKEREKERICCCLCFSFKKKRKKKSYLS